MIITLMGDRTIGAKVLHMVETKLVLIQTRTLWIKMLIAFPKATTNKITKNI